MTTQSRTSDKLRVVIVGGGVAALEAALALADLAPDTTDVTVIAPNTEFFYRPLAVREPFAYGAASRYPLPLILDHAGAKLVVDELGWVEPDKQTVHTKGVKSFEYDALLLALGARAVPRYRHALTIDDRRLDETMQGLIQDVEGGYTKSVAFVSPGRMAWPLPLYELALMTANRAYDMGEDLKVAIVTPENAPLAIFGAGVSGALEELLQRAHIEMITSAYAEVPGTGHVVIKPADRHLEVGRVVALPELYGPSIRGIPLGQHGFVRTDIHGRVPDIGPVYAAGDAVDFAVKHGGIAAQQADAAAESIAALAGAPVQPQPFHPIVRGMLLTGDRPLYLTARIAGGHGFSSEVSETCPWSPATKIAARYLAPVLADHDREQVVSR
jgi:sulfide:quinone oxidoreductase